VLTLVNLLPRNLVEMKVASGRTEQYHGNYMNPLVRSAAFSLVKSSLSYSRLTNVSHCNGGPKTYLKPLNPVAV
jgi:hypothetical protein